MRRVSPWVAALAVGAVVALGVGLDRLGLPEDDPEAAATEPAPPVTSGAWFCAVGDSRAERTLRAVAAAPPSTSGRPAEVVVSEFRDGTATVLEDLPVFPSSSAPVDLGAGAPATGLSVRWWSQPVAATRLWGLPGGETPPGTVAGPCVADSSDTWIVPGLATAGGATARVVLANPYDSDAAVSVVLATPEGVREPRLLENVTVPARGTRTVVLNEHAPAEPDLGVIVRTRSGRIVAEGLQFLDAAIGGVDGAALAAAAPAAAETWTIPSFSPDGESTESWLWVTTPGPEPASVILTAHTDAGGVVPEEAGELIVEPGQVRRVDLRGIVEGDRPGLTVSSDNGAPIVAAAATRVAGGQDEGGGGTGFTVQLGVVEPSPGWVLTLPADGDRRLELQIVNPGGETAVVDTTLWAGAGVVRPDELQGVEVPPGSSRTLDITDVVPDVEDITAFATARQGRVVVGGRAARAEGPLGLVAYAGVPTARWEGGISAPAVRHRPGLTRRLGTGSDDGDGDGLEPEPGEEEPSPAPATPPPAPTGDGPTGSG